MLFIPDANEHWSEVFPLTEKLLQACAVIVWTYGIGVGIVADEAAVFIPDSGEVGTKFVLLPPIVEELNTL